MKTVLKLTTNKVIYQLIKNVLYASALPELKIIGKECCTRAYLAGAFLSCGSVNNPETSNYHLEMSFNEEEFAQFIADLINRFELNAKIIKRRNKYVVYLKSSEKIRAELS